MIKNVIALILVMLLMALMFTGCKKPDDVYYVPSDLTSSNEDNASEKTETETDTDTDSQLSQEDNLIEIPSAWQTGGDSDKSDTSSKKNDTGTSSKKPANDKSSTPESSSSSKVEIPSDISKPEDMTVSKDDEGYDPWQGL